MTRPRGATTRRSEDEQAQATSSVEEIGQLLRYARERQDLDLLSVHDRLSRPITLIEALETGDLANLPDQAGAISTLRRYANLLGLDGDSLALQMIDAWPATDRATAPSGRRRHEQRKQERLAATGAVPAVTAVAGEPLHLRAFTQTGPVPRIGRGPSPTGGGSASGGLETTGPPTGTFPVVPHDDIRRSKRSLRRARRKANAPGWLKVTTWLVALSLLIVLGGFGILHWRSDWLVRAHILRVTGPNGAPLPARAGGGTKSTPRQKAAVQAVQIGNQSASYSVSSPAFVVKIATSGNCWVQITSSTSSAPLVSGVQPAGKVLSVPAAGTMVVQVGSKSVLVGITVNGKAVYLNAPQVTPFTYTFAPASPASPG